MKKKRIFGIIINEQRGRGQRTAPAYFHSWVRNINPLDAIKEGLECFVTAERLEYLITAYTKEEYYYRHVKSIVDWREKAMIEFFFYYLRPSENDYIYNKLDIEKKGLYYNLQEWLSDL